LNCNEIVDGLLSGVSGSESIVISSSDSQSFSFCCFSLGGILCLLGGPKSALSCSLGILCSSQCVASSSCSILLLIVIILSGTNLNACSFESISVLISFISLVGCLELLLCSLSLVYKCLSSGGSGLG
jgi:hypothetical protein